MSTMFSNKSVFRIGLSVLCNSHMIGTLYPFSALIYFGRSLHCWDIIIRGLELSLFKPQSLLRDTIHYMNYRAFLSNVISTFDISDKLIEMPSDLYRDFGFYSIMRYNYLNHNNNCCFEMNLSISASGLFLSLYNATICTSQMHVS